MPTITITDNTDLNLTASTGDNNATINKYLVNALVYKHPVPDPGSLANTKISDVNAEIFPVSFSAGGEGKFAVEKSTLDVQVQLGGSVGVLKDKKADDVYSTFGVKRDNATAALVSFGVTGTVSLGPSVTTGDFSFGITDKATLELTSLHPAAATDTFAAALGDAARALTIPHEIQDLEAIPVGDICQLEADSSISFKASVTASFLNNPLATVSLEKLVSVNLNATGSATIEATVSHSSKHQISILKQSDSKLVLAVGITHTDDFETSLTVSAGVAANVGSEDALAFLLKNFSANSDDELKKIKAEMPPAEFDQLNSDIKSAIDATLSKSFAASLKAAIDLTDQTADTFVFSIDLDAVNGNAQSRNALIQALEGDLTAITAKGANFPGITFVSSVLTVTDKVTHSIALHLLGILNFSDTHTFFTQQKVKAGVTGDTKELIISDETILVVVNNLASEKLREAVVKGVTLTLPASANTPEEKTPVGIVYFDREGNTDRVHLQEFVNVCEEMQAANAAQAAALLAENLKHFGVCSLAIDLNLTQAQCRDLFIRADGTALEQVDYIAAACKAQQTILAQTGDFRLKLYNIVPSNLTAGVWHDLLEAGSGQNIEIVLKNEVGLSEVQAEIAVTDVLTLEFWSDAMAAYAKALHDGKPLANLGKKFVKASDMGFNEPWFVLTAWRFAGKPSAAPLFTSTLLPSAAKQAVASSNSRPSI